MNVLLSPLPLDGGGAGGGGDYGGERHADLATSGTGFTPIPNPSPIQGKGDLRGRP
jgi:NADH dehydrogenase [ubiquinone] 1 alpha subcomplex assembly factor 7